VGREDSSRAIQIDRHQEVLKGRFSVEILIGLFPMISKVWGLVVPEDVSRTIQTDHFQEVSGGYFLVEIRIDRSTESGLEDNSVAIQICCSPGG